MRRFIKSLPGKAVGQLVVMSMLLPTLTLMLLGKAQAQLTQQPTWAVLPFVVDPKASGMPSSGATAAESVSSEFSKTNLYDVVPQEQIKRAADTLGVQLPIPQDDQTTLLRLSQEVRASTVVTGHVVDYKILSSGGGKQAVVAMNIIVTDVASGLPINGAAVTGKSTLRPGDVSNETLVNEAIAAGASSGVATIRGQTLPTGTVLNTTPDTALINQGSRSGFKPGQKVVVVRGREEVARGAITEVEADSAYLHPTFIKKGIQPGDRVRVIFDVRAVQQLSPIGNPVLEKRPASHSSSGFFQVLLLIGLGAILLGGGRNHTQNGASGLVAEAEMFPDPTGDPSVKLHWNSDIFVRANTTRVQWQIWRSDVPDSPVLVVQGTTLQAHDVSTQAHAGTFSSLAGFNNQIGGSTCDFSSPPGDDTIQDHNVSGPAPGHAYQYRIELVYRIAAIDLPDGGNTGGTTSSTTGLTGGTTGGTNTGLTTGGNTGGTNTGGTNTGTTSGSGGFCYFLSSQTFANGLATPLVRSVGQQPQQHASIQKQTSDPLTKTIVFQFTSANTGGASLQIEYVIEESLSPLFPRNGTRLAHIPEGSTVASVTSSDVGQISLTTNNDLFQDVAPQTPIYWRVGARNVNDSPGPVPDSAGNRYVVGPTQQFVRGETPPPPPQAQ